jgi:hypothetical protein
LSDRATVAGIDASADTMRSEILIRIVRQNLTAKRSLGYDM